MKTWETIKFWAVVLNGIILLFLSVMSYTNTNESEELNKNISQKDSVIADYKLKFIAVTSKIDNSIYQPIKDTSISKNNNISDSMSK